MNFKITIQCRLMKLWWKLSPAIIEPELISVTLYLIPRFLKPTRTRRPNLFKNSEPYTIQNSY
jgi:hypothetical protein